ncbi:hypothetical protein FACS1894122_07930 [Alphaproteobacteria bacterium]|nr:hypothetical protein FACS1894122_07930 [Alphaproteobacteria bacterium]
MEKGRAFETIVGFFVLLVALFFFYFVYNQSNWKRMDGYMLTAKFDRADGLADGVDVKLSGVRIGKILSVKIDPETFLATVKFSVPDNIKLPKDSSATVQSDGLFGGRYLALTPGGEEADIPHGGEIENTVGPTNLESLIGKFMLSKDSDQRDAGSKNTETSQAMETSKDIGITKDAEETEAPKNPKDTEASRDSKDTEASRDSKESEASRDSKESEASRDSKELEASRDSKELEASRDSKELEASRDSKETEASRDSKELEASRDSKELEASRDSKELEASRDSKETEASRDSKETEASRDSKETEASRDSKETEASRDSKEME